jgi:hypothetical protein
MPVLVFSQSSDDKALLLCTEVVGPIEIDGSFERFRFNLEATLDGAPIMGMWVVDVK